jgi:hypothetical protein
MPPRNDPVLDSGFPQEDHPARTGKLLPRALIWAGPLAVAVTLLLDMPDTGFPAWRGWTALALAVASAALYAIWNWRSKSLDCPRCRQRLARVGRDTQYAYYPCPSCRVMWRSEAERRPELDFTDFD